MTLNTQHSTLNFSGFGDSLVNSFLRAKQELREAEATLAKMEQSMTQSETLLEEMRLLVARRKAVLAPLEALANIYGQVGTS